MTILCNKNITKLRARLVDYNRHYNVIDIPMA